MRELENQLHTLEASKPSAPPALKFKVNIMFIVFVFKIVITFELQAKLINK